MSKKKITDPEAEMKKLMAHAVEIAQAPFTSDRDPDLPSLRSVAEELGTTVIRTRKLLITAGFFSSPTATKVQELKSAGKTIEEIGEELKLGPAAVYGYLPFTWNAYNLPQTSANSDRHKRYRSTRKLRAAVEAGEWSEQLWKTVIVFQDYPFTTSGRGSREGTKYSYQVGKKSGACGRHYKGKDVDGYGNEMWVTTYGEEKEGGEKKERSISRSTVELAFKTYLEVKEHEGIVAGPKKLGVFGASYLLPIFQRIF